MLFFLQGDLTGKEKESNNVILFSILYKYEAIIFVLKHNELCIIGFAHSYHVGNICTNFLIILFAVKYS